MQVHLLAIAKPLANEYSASLFRRLRPQARAKRQEIQGFMGLGAGTGAPLFPLYRPEMVRPYC